MTRIVVRNLPDKITKEKLLELFSEKGTVTDVQLKYAKNGVFRKFAFIGYQKQEQADDALKSLNKTYINTSKIEIEPCRSLAEQGQTKAWSKHSKENSSLKKKRECDNGDGQSDEAHQPNNKRIKDPKLEKLLTEYKNDDMFKEFMTSELQGETALLEVPQSDGDAMKDNSNTVEDNTKLADKSISDIEYFKLKTGQDSLDIKSGDSKKKATGKQPKNIKLFTVKVYGLPNKLKKSKIKDFLEVKPFTIRRACGVMGLLYVGFKTEHEMKKALYKNRSFFKGKRIIVREVRNEDDAKNAEMNEKWREQEENVKKAETVAESGRIFVRNLPYVATEEEIKEMFEKYGPIADIILPIDSVTRKPKGFGIVAFVMPEHASKAFTELDGTIFQGRMLHLIPAIEKNPKSEGGGDDDLGGFKRSKMLKNKLNAGNRTNWNTFFVNENALAAAMAESYNTSKENVLEDNRNAAVRLALGETEIVNKIREFLEENDVCLDSFVDVFYRPRSTTAILAKNLPYGTRAEEIRQIFSEFGELKRVVLPPYGVTAIVEFIEPYEAKSAFRRVAYSDFKGVPMFLEWAPEAIFDGRDRNGGRVKGEGTSPLNPSQEPGSDELNEDGRKFGFGSDYIPLEGSQTEGATIFVKNLNFSTDEDSLREHFARCGKILSATVARKMDPKQPGKKLSLGYGFIQFSSKGEADEALKRLQFSKLDRHTLELKRSHRTIRPESEKVQRHPSGGGKPSTKILVKNVPFQATRREIQDLFKVFGEIKSVRLPKKMVGTGSHRGFCFVEYHTVHDAKRALKSLQESTHLYGRRLVLEWASTDDDDVDKMRTKTAERFSAGNSTGKKAIMMDENSEMD